MKSGLLSYVRILIILCLFSEEVAKVVEPLDELIAI